MSEQERAWIVYPDGRKFGPFESVDLAIQVRVYVERVERREDLAVTRESETRFSQFAPLNRRPLYLSSGAADSPLHRPKKPCLASGSPGKVLQNMQEEVMR